MEKTTKGYIVLAEKALRTNQPRVASLYMKQGIAIAESERSKPLSDFPEMRLIQAKRRLVEELPDIIDSMSASISAFSEQFSRSLVDMRKAMAPVLKNMSDNLKPVMKQMRNTPAFMEAIKEQQEDL